MRSFFKQILTDLYLYAGTRMLDKLTDEEITKLCDILEKVSKLYSYIPIEKQKEIIEAQLLKDTEYVNINARLISKWLEQNGKQYFAQDCHKERLTEDDYTPLVGEEREQKLKEWEKALLQMETNFTSPTVKGSGTRLRESMGVKPFVVNGLEIYAKSIEEAQMIYNESVLPENKEGDEL